MEPHSLVGGTGEGGWGGRGLACGLQDQRLMARPPARAGGRSGLLTGGESGKPNGYFLPSPKGDPPTFPARPAGGRAVTSVPTRGPQARYPVRGTASPTQPHQRRGSRGRNLLPRGFFPPFLPKKWGPGWASQVPCRSNGVRKPCTPIQAGYPPTPCQTKNTAVPHRPRRCFFQRGGKGPLSPQSPAAGSPSPRRSGRSHSPCCPPWCRPAQWPARWCRW